MVDLQTVCSMCGDVGFPDKLFRCNKCRLRFQHSYCSNYYGEVGGEIEVCDWCESEERTNNNNNNSMKLQNKRSSSSSTSANRSEIKLPHHHERDDVAVADKGKTPTGAPSPRTPTRRYKLLKDVMC